MKGSKAFEELAVASARTRRIRNLAGLVAALSLDFALLHSFFIHFGADPAGAVFRSAKQEQIYTRIIIRLPNPAPGQFGRIGSGCNIGCFG